MNRQQTIDAINQMIPPGRVRPGKRPPGGVIQIWVTRACDRACPHCTQGGNLKGHSGYISLKQFDQACATLSDYFGIVGVFGGNPCLHPQFPRLCEILARHVPFNRRGLWTNRLMGHGRVCRETFNPVYSNCNVHGDLAAYEEFRRDWRSARVFGLWNDSRHSPPFVAMRDLIEDEDERWRLIADCDINRYWSAMIGVFRGELRAWFCEIAGAQSILHQYEDDYPDTGLPVEPGWWRRPMGDFAEQVRVHCHACGVPLRGHGALATDEEAVEQTTETHAGVCQPKRAGAQVRIVTSLDELDPRVARFTDYLGGARESCGAG